MNTQVFMKAVSLIPWSWTFM